MHQIHTSTSIDAPPAQVREAFFNALTGPALDLLITDFSSDSPELEAGTRFKVSIVSDGKPMALAPVVQKNTADEFLWIGVLGYLWIFAGHHRFQFLEGANATQTTFVHEEDVSGLLAGLVMWMARDSISRWFAAVNQSLKEAAEQGYSQASSGSTT